MASASASWPGVAIGTCPKAECAALAPDLFQRLLGHEFGDLIQADFGAFNFARSFHYRLGHAVDVPVHAVKEDLNPHAHCRFLTYSNKLPAARVQHLTTHLQARLQLLHSTCNSCIACIAFLLLSSFG